MAPTKFLLDPRVLDDCIGDGVPDVEIEGTAVAFAKYRNILPDYIFYLSNFDADFKPAIPPSLLKFPHRKQEGQIMVDLRYQRANVVLIPYLSEDMLSLADDFPVQKILFNGRFLKGNAETLKNYGVKIL